MNRRGGPPQALNCIRAIAGSVPKVTVEADPIVTPAQLDQAQAAGAQFLVSPSGSDRIIDNAACLCGYGGRRIGSSALRRIPHSDAAD
ncbi:hypothetical protein KBI52_09030 [Microvirga sp. HBU67558]|uniref:hypothetical protein n=1 Tax=Microvirga TaxID=186650 RepID=UPI001B359FDF|nr:hypothetical protein [Microvirga sp. HBU67558]